MSYLLTGSVVYLTDNCEGQAYGAVWNYPNYRVRGEIFFSSRGLAYVLYGDEHSKSVELIKSEYTSDGCNSPSGDYGPINAVHTMYLNDSSVTGLDFETDDGHIPNISFGTKE